MPAFLTHRIIGEKVIKRLGKDTGLNNSAFYLGCQGPDILYYNWLSPRCGFLLSMEMHYKNTGELFDHALGFIMKYNKKDKNDLISYIAGFLTHIVVDIDLHEFIFHSVGNKIRKHHAIEHMWDNYVLNKRNMELSNLKSKKDIVNPGSGISEWYISAAKIIYGKKLKAGSLKKAVHHYVKRHIFKFADSDTAGGKIIRFGHMIKQKMIKTAKLDTIFHSDEYYKMSLRLSIECIEKSCELINTMLTYLSGEKRQPLYNNGSIGYAGPYSHNIRDEIKQDLHSLFAQATG
jgi:hypothetical protein